MIKEWFKGKPKRQPVAPEGRVLSGHVCDERKKVCENQLSNGDCTFDLCQYPYGCDDEHLTGEPCDTCRHKSCENVMLSDRENDIKEEI